MGRKINRKDFLKVSIVSCAATAAVTASLAQNAVKPLVAKAANTMAPVNETGDFPYAIDPKFQRMRGDKILYVRQFNIEESKKPIKYTIPDTSKITGKKDYGQDLPRLNAEAWGVKDRAATLPETGVRFRLQSDCSILPNRKNEIGWRQLDVALMYASWAVEFNYSGYTASGQSPSSVIALHPIDPVTYKIKGDELAIVPGLYHWDNQMAEDMRQQGKVWKFNSPEEATKHVKKAARFLGADLVGIAPYDDRWTYANWCRPIGKPFKAPNGRTELAPFNVEKAKKTGEIEVFGQHTVDADWEKYAGFKPKSVIVMAFEMDYEAFRTAPSIVCSAAPGKIYSKMPETAFKVACFLRKMGYNAAPSGNDTGMSVPIAVQAGLGEAGRLGLLVTEKYGPRVRIAKVYTDLELVPDKPRSFGVRDFCKLCKKCADVCPGQAISHEDSPKILQPEDCGASEQPYVEKWSVNAERCFSFYGYNGGDCGQCIAVCSWNKIDQWNHDIARIATKVPLLQDVARKFDEWFGYNGPCNPEERIESKWVENAVIDFWNRIEPIQK